MYAEEFLALIEIPHCHNCDVRTEMVTWVLPLDSPGRETWCNACVLDGVVG